MVTRERTTERGFTLLEISVAMAIFGIFLYIIVMLTSEMKRNEKKYPVNFMEHPQVSAVMARMRRDVFDASYYPQEVGGFDQSGQVLIVATIHKDGTIESVVYDFKTPGEVHRRTFLGNVQQTEWIARGLPVFNWSPLDDGAHVGVEIKAYDGPSLAIDQIFFPRAKAAG